jgi:hypothetical protein
MQRFVARGLIARQHDLWRTASHFSVNGIVPAPLYDFMREAVFTVTS